MDPNVQIQSSSKRQREEDDDTEQLSTPKRAFNHPPLPHDTPLNHNSGSHHSTHTSALSEDSRNVRRDQKTLKAHIELELGDATFESSSIVDLICPDPEERAKTIQSALLDAHIYSVSGEVVSISGWPASGSLESRYYQPLTDLLNAIVDAFKSHFPSKSYLVRSKLRFHNYSKEMWESLEGATALKPDVLGTIGLHITTFGANERCSWYSAEIPCEVKGSWRDLVAQAGTYARCAFAAADNRNFVPAFGFCHKSSAFRLLFYHHGGLVASEPMDLLDRSGFIAFVTAITGMLNWKSPLDAGYQCGQSHSHFRFENDLFRISRTLCRRPRVRGRNTRVFDLERESLEPPTREVIATPVHELARGEASSRPSTLDPVSRLPLNRPSSVQPIPNPPPFPDHMVLKCSYPLESRVLEEDMFKSVEGFIGIPEIIAGYDVESFPVPEDAKHWNIFGRKTENPAADFRKHRHLLFKTAGLPLSSATSPKQLGYAVLHAIMGHCALFTQAGYLHRDISEGNILLLKSKELRYIPQLLQDLVTSHDCVGVLIDGDAARKWNTKQEPASHRSGTKPFLSMRITLLWTDGDPFTHTPLDDLESFVWVLLFILLQKTTNPTHKENHWWQRLNSDQLDTLGQTKQSILNTWLSPEDLNIDLDTAFSPPLTIFKQLLVEWLQLATRYRTKPPRTVATIEEETRSAYRAYVQAGLRCLPNLPDAWPTVPDSS